MNKQIARDLINSSMGREPCDLVIRNAQVVDVCGSTVYKADVYVKDGYIVGFDGERTANKEIDGSSGKVLVNRF